jgi:hypothetical protein
VIAPARATRRTSAPTVRADATATGALAAQARSPPGGGVVASTSGGSAGSSRTTAPSSPTTSTGSAAAGTAAPQSTINASRTARTSTRGG